MCTGNSNDVYVISGTTLLTTLTAGATGSQNFSGGSCMTCGVATDASTGLAWLAEGTITSSGQLQSLNPVTSVFGAPLDLFGEMTSEDISIDPVRHLILSALENGNFQIIDTVTNAVFNSATSFAPWNWTQRPRIARLASPWRRASSRRRSFSRTLSQATYTPGAPGTWSAPATIQDFPDFSSFVSAGISGIAVAPGSHLAGVTDEFGGPAFGVVQLPATSGVGDAQCGGLRRRNDAERPRRSAVGHGVGPPYNDGVHEPEQRQGDSGDQQPHRTYLALVDMETLLDPTANAGDAHG